MSTTLFYSKRGVDYVKASQGTPCNRSTQRISEAATFATPENAVEWGRDKVFGPKALVEAVPVAAPREPVGRTVNPSLERSIEQGGIGWTNREDADEVLFGAV